MIYENGTTAVTAPKAEKPIKTKRTDTEKLSEYYEQKRKLLEQQNATRQKGKDIENKLVKTNSKIQEYENKALFKICKEMNITTKDIISFLQKIPKGTTLEDIEKQLFINTFISDDNGGRI